MTYTIIAIVVLVVVVLFVLLSKKPEQAGPGPTEKKTPEAKPKSIKPAPGPEPKAAEQAKKEAPLAAEALAAKEPAAKPAPPPRDLAELRKGLAKARAETGFLGRLASLFAGKKELDPTIADQVEEILLTSDVGVAIIQTILVCLCEGL